MIDKQSLNRQNSCYQQNSYNHTSYLTRGWVVALLAIGATFLWGSAYPAVKSGYEWFQVSGQDTAAKLLFAGIRFVLAGLLVRLFSLLRYRRIMPLTKEEVWPVFRLGMVQTTLQYIFFYIGLSNATGSKSAILNSFGTFAAVLAAPLVYRNEKLTHRKVLGCLCGLAGVILVNLDGQGLGTFRLNGEGFILLSTAFSAISFFQSKAVAQKVEVMKATGYQLLFGGLVLVALGLLFGGRLHWEEPTAWLLLAYMALLSAAAFTIWTALLAKNPVGRVSVYNLLVPVFGTMLSGVFLGENIATAGNLFSLILVSVGIGIVNKE